MVVVVALAEVAKDKLICRAKLGSYAILASLFGSLLVFTIHSTIKVTKAPIESVIILMRFFSFSVMFTKKRKGDILRDRLKVSLITLLFICHTKKTIAYKANSF